jgi:aromatic ring-cleaving dioxygenase
MTDATAAETGGPLDPARIQGYHAHVYYDPATRQIAERLRERIGGRFEATLGRWHDRPVGPHSAAMYQVAFPVAEFPRLVPWLMLNREGLSILIHPLTGDDYEDHSRFALWLGDKLALDLERLRAPIA